MKNNVGKKIMLVSIIFHLVLKHLEICVKYYIFHLKISLKIQSKRDFINDILVMVIQICI